jgi:hypothetical protein
VPRDGRDSVETLVSLTTLPQNLAVGPDGSLYVDQSFTPPEAVLYRHADRHVDARIPTPITSAGGAAAYWTALPTRDPRILVALEGNKSRIMVVRPQSAAIPEPFMDTQEDTSGPVTIVGNDQVALLLGRPPNRVVAVATTDGHLVRRFAKDEIDGDAVDGLAATPDGRDLYVASNGAIAVVPVTGGTPRRVTGGVSVAVDPGGRYLVVERSTPSETQLARVDIATGAETAIPLDARFNLPPYQFAYGANPIAHDGRLVVRVATRDSWFWPSGILDPRTGQVELIDVGVPLDMFSGGWLPDGRVMTFATPTFSSLWRFRAEDPTP